MGFPENLRKKPVLEHVSMPQESLLFNSTTSFFRKSLRYVPEHTLIKRKVCLFDRSLHRHVESGASALFVSFFPQLTNGRARCRQCDQSRDAITIMSDAASFC